MRAAARPHRSGPSWTGAYARLLSVAPVILPASAIVAIGPMSGDGYRPSKAIVFGILDAHRELKDGLRALADEYPELELEYVAELLLTLDLPARAWQGED